MKTIDERRPYQREYRAKRCAEEPEFREWSGAVCRKYRKVHRLALTAPRRQERTKTEVKAAHAAVVRKFGRKYRLKARYGLTLEDYDAILKQQGGVCLFCDRKTEAHLDVDHCHVTGLVRALLCRSCNAGLGNFGENPVIIGRAAQFMELWVQYVFELCNREESNMASDKIVSGKNEITRAPSTPMRDAILHELNQPICGDRPPPINGLQAVARALVIKAGAQDIQAIKEVLDRIDGRPPSASADDQSRRLLNVTWTHALSKLKSSTQGVPKGRSPKGRKRVGRRIKQSAIRPNAQAKRSSSRLCRSKKGRGTSREA